MKIIPWLVLALFAALAAWTTFAPPPAEVVAQAHTYFTDEVMANGVEYAFQRRLLFWSGTLLHLALLLAFLGGWGQRVIARCRDFAGGWWLPTLLLSGGFFFLLLCYINLPFDLARFVLQREWGLTSRRLGPWFEDYGKALAVGAVTEGIALVGLYLLMRWLPRIWWLAAAAGSVVLAALFTLLLPIVIAPLFNTFTPIAQTKWAAWEQPLHRLVDKVGVPVQELLVMDASIQSSHTNAYFTGFGGTRRIVLYDNLLMKHTLPEVESILAHELGHWHHDHIYKGIALGGAAALVGFFLLACILKWAKGPFGLYGPSDPAGLPIVLFAFFLGYWLTLPIANAVTRHFERQADMMSLELAGQPDVFIAVEKKLAIDNIGNVTSEPWNVWLFATHPPAVERIQMGEEWKREHGP
jgi:STE24 endopeptidase